MANKPKSFKRKALHAGGWQVAKRAAKSVSYLGSIVVIGLVGHDIKKKGLFRGLLNSGLDAIPILGTVKNAAELVRGDFIPDKSSESKEAIGKFPNAGSGDSKQKNG
ncbi:MAG: hypothetical protein R2681_18400 [Pyrinomonadaceae bacterium]